MEDKRMVSGLLGKQLPAKVGCGFNSRVLRGFWCSDPNAVLLEAW